MFTLIKNATVYAPEYLGKQDVLIANGIIEHIAPTIELPPILEVNVLAAEGLTAIPGLIDNHVHILGGGGEASYQSQTRALEVSDLIKGGVTTVIGLLGTDGVSRTLSSLVAKTRALREQGFSAYCLSGNYRIPAYTATGDIFSDMLLVDCMIGSGEVAINDHRSSQPSQQDFNTLVADTYVAGMLSGKAGVTNVHIGSGKHGLQFLRNLLENTELPAHTILPTHINRSEEILSEGIDYSINHDAPIDFTTSRDTNTPVCHPLNAHNCLARALAEGVKLGNVTFSSDGQGSLPIYADGKVVGFGIGEVRSVFEEIMHCVSVHKMSLTNALYPATVNPARIYKLANKGRIAKGFDGDVVLVKGNNIIYTISAGKVFANA